MDVQQDHFHSLVVEDDTVTRLMLQRVLQQRGHQVVAVADAEAALSAMASFEPSLILLDVGLPGMDGLAFSRWLRARSERIQPLVMVITAQVAPPDLQSVLDAGADDYLPKPLELQVLGIRLAIAENRIRDRAQRFRAEREREVYWRRLEQAQRVESLGVLASGIAHDFNNILAGILGNASLARMDAHPETELYTNLGQIEALSLRAAELCKQMTAYAGKIRPVLESVDVAELIQGAITNLREGLNPTPVISLLVGAGVQRVLGDRSQIDQAIRVLLINAFEAIEGGGGSIRVAVSPSFPTPDELLTAHLSPELPQGDYVCVEVTDTGCGMSEEVRQRVFDPFFSTKFAGRGLGLAALAGIVRTHRGAVSVQSQPRQGSTFKLWLPAVDPGAFDAESLELNETAGNYRRRLALVADDEESVRKVASRILETRGYEVVVAVNGREAVQMFEGASSDYDLALIDLTMPRMDGVQVCSRIRALRHDIRLVLMSGYSEEEALTRFGESGCDAFLVKPFTMEALLGKVQEPSP